MATFIRLGALRTVPATMLVAGIVFAAGSVRAGEWVA